MGEYVIEQWTEEQLQEHRQKYPQSVIDGPWVFKDTDGLIMGFYATEIEAQAERDQLVLTDAIETQFEAWVLRVSIGYKLTVGQVHDIVNSYLH